ncbi:protein shisa-1-like [Microcaecilia unicolor]|uniref:Protein shisa-1-like n=1 Tax=Microcaecilia unicolor TaxID=1415580 RepID=A0A6P7YR92_9AMPH|nr:protein shisa-1-like [Microcaecilia unicolor]
MVCTGLLPLLLGPCILGVLVSVSGKLFGSGEYCHGWTTGHQVWHEGFQCPERYDAPEATFCCGSCNLRYCCTSRETRLDQGLCYNENLMDLVATEDHSSTKNATVPTYLPFLLVASVFLAFVVAGSLLGLCCCRCQNPGGEMPQSGPLPVQGQLLEPQPAADTRAPPCLWSSSSNSAASDSASGHPQASEDLNLYKSMPAHFPSMGCPQGAQYHPSIKVPFIQSAFVRYGAPAEHAILMNMTSAPLLDERTLYKHLTHSYPAGVVRCDQGMYSGAPR